MPLLTQSVCTPVGSTTECLYTYASTTMPYTFDVGVSVMLGGILMFFIAYWFIGLVRTSSWNI